MKTIGITGGVGCGKSSLLEYIKNNYNCEIVMADDVGNKVKEPGERCYRQLIDLLGEAIIDVNSREGFIDKKAMAAAIFADEKLLKRVNDIIHPAVTEYILQQRDLRKKEGKLDYFFIEAALLIECGYRKYVDEMWFIYTKKELRTERLKKQRGYSDEKIESIMASQLTDEEFEAGCDFTIDNSFSLEESFRQIDELLKQEKKIDC